MTLTYDNLTTEDGSADLREAVQKILPLLARNAERAEADRALPLESYQALIESGAL